MKVFYIGVIRNTDKDGLELASVRDLSSFSFFERSSVSQFMSFFALTVATRTQAGQRQSVEEGANYVGHVYARSEGLAGVVITDKEYPVRVAFSLLNTMLDSYITRFPRAEWINVTQATPTSLALPELDQMIVKYQDPHQADSILKVQQELDETKIVLHKTIESVLARGEKLDSLVDKSEALSSTSRMFYKQAQKTNSCCVIC
ncbi:snare-like protein [Nadsonia fulvescens var. elongata DSM 6958]|uniref:Synaptobrevin homolog YKT6 n=1 Tax=Nadsonia fulvescens var. elongata DSM 6958 TaxID=857566 RepID=A0A1E3PMX9_9ASCO|nr:snare-like protein [Nadsonia fulvescens var. elongata DSM 6958]